MIILRLKYPKSDSWSDREKRVIAGDGNCQFAAISDQLFDNVGYADYVREEAVKWLRQNKDWELPNGAILWHFACIPFFPFLILRSI